MSRRIRRHPSVADDILDIATHIAQDNIEFALHFLDAVERTIEWLRDQPGAGRLRDFDHPSLAKLRSGSVKNFRNYLVFYEVEPHGIYVAAVLHGARDLPRVLHLRVSGE